MLKGWWTYAVVLIAMLGALSACNSGDGDDDVVEVRRYDFVTYLPLTVVVVLAAVLSACVKVLSNSCLILASLANSMKTAWLTTRLRWVRNRLAASVASSATSA